MSSPIVSIWFSNHTRTHLRVKCNATHTYAGITDINLVNSKPVRIHEPPTHMEHGAIDIQTSKIECLKVKVLVAVLSDSATLWTVAL